MNALLLGLIALSLLLIAWVIRNPSLETPGSRLVGIAALALLPALVSLGGVSQHLEQSKQTRFCLSCHEMQPYGQSLWIDDPDHLQASHFQNARVPREFACYTCHTQYTMYGDMAAKWAGMKHVLVHFFGETPEPGDIVLYQPYENRECLHCHNGARSFLEGAGHEEMLAELESGEVSCLDCHDAGHGVTSLPNRPLWREGGEDTRVGH